MPVDRLASPLRYFFFVFVAVALAACESGGNNKPSVDAGSDQSVGEGAVVTLNAAATKGKDPITYLWTQTSGTAVMLSDTTAASPTFTAPFVDADETLTFEVELTDDKMRTAVDTVSVTIVNNAPTADAGADQTLVEGVAVALDGSASSHMSGGTIVSYAWVQTAGTPVLNLAGADTEFPTFTTALVNADEVVTFELTVTDDDGDADTDSVDITVLDDTAPVADAGPDQTVDEGTAPVTLDGSNSSDAVGTSLSYAWVQTGGAAVVLANATTAMPSFTAPQVGSAGDTLTFELTVTDDAAQAASDTVDVIVQNVNQLPTANAGADQMVAEGAVVNLDGSGSADTDGTIASYAWTQTGGPAVTLTGADTATPSFTAPLVAAATALTFELTVTDNDGGQGTDSVVVDIVTFNVPPVANAGPDQSVDDESLVNLNGSGSSDPDGAIAVYAWVQTAGSNVVLNNANTATPDFTAPNVIGSPEVFSFELTVTDNDPTNPKTSIDTVSITVNPVNADPVSSAGPDQTVTEQTPVNLDGSASSDADGSIASFAWTQTAGTSVTLSGADTATPSFTAPAVGAAGDTLTFQLEVTDNEGATATDAVNVQVDNDPLLSDPPTAVAGPDQTVLAAVLVTLDGSGSTDTDGTITAYQWTQTGGTAVTLTNADQAVATFTSPAAPDTLTFELEVTDDDAATATDTVVITVNSPPTANAGPDQTVLEQTAVNLTGAASSDVDGTITYAWTQTAGTAVVLTGADTATPSFTAPSVDPAGETLTFELTVTDDGGAVDTDSVDIQVDNDPSLSNAPTAVAGPDQVVLAGVLVTLDGSGSSDTDGTITAYQWTQTGGTAVTLTNADQAVATFTSPAAPDTLTFELEVTDNDAATGTDTVVITVNSPPTANAGPDQTVLEQTAVNLDGSGSSDVDGTITYAWTQTAGTAVTLTGADTAAPSFTAPSVDSAGETLTFELTVTDDGGSADSDAVDVQVDNDPTLNIPPTANAGPDQSVAEGVVVTLDGSGSSDDGSITAYQWTQTAGTTTVTLTNADQAVATFTSPTGPDTLTFELEVTDDETGTDTDTVDVDIAGTVTVAGKVTFHEIPHGALGTGLDFTSIVELPARLVTVEVIDATDDVTVIASTKTDTSGDYSFDLDTNLDIFVRVRAEMVETGPAPSWNFRIVDNTNSDAQYVLDTAEFNTGVANQVVDILADTVFDGSDYTSRNGAPFAILDAVYSAFQTVLGANATTDFVPLDLHWSINNSTVSGDLTLGEIGNAFYRGGNPIDGIYLRGNEDDNTDEYDQHVVVHEWGHYFEDTIARSDSIGGAHTLSDILDPRVSFGEGWGNAWSAIALGDTLYIDSFSMNQAISGGFDVEDGTLFNGANLVPGWYNERSIQEILYDLVDGADDGMDTLSLGFQPIYDVFVDQQSTTTAFTSVFSFIDALKSDRPGDALAIDSLLAAQSIDAVADEWGTGETNDAGSADTLPIYKTVTVNGAAVNVCSDDAFGGVNKLNTIQFVRLTIPTAGMHTFTATATVIPVGETTDPDMWLSRPEVPPPNIFEVFESSDADSESGVSVNFLPAADYMLQVFDFNNRGSSKLTTGDPSGPSIGRACFDVTVTQP